MSKRVKWLVIGVLLLIIGGILFAVGMVAVNWNFLSLDTNKYQTNTYDIAEEFGSLSIINDTTDIVFKKGEAKVVCFENENIRHSVSVNNGVLEIRANDNRKWYNYIGFNFNNPKITIYLPSNQYDALKIEGDTGDVNLSDISFNDIQIALHTGDIRLSNLNSNNISLKTTTGKMQLQNIECRGLLSTAVSTGDNELKNIKCNSFASNGSTGDLDIENLIVAEKTSIERDTGDIEFEGLDANEIYIKTDTGDVEGDLRSEKVFIINTDTGRVNVPKTITGGKCEITTNTGDIKIEIEK